MVFGVYKLYGEYFGGVYDSFEDYYKETFSPDAEQVFLTDFRVHGKTYADKKAAARDIGVEISNTFGLVSLFWSECMYIGDRLQGLAARYGLVKEFRENGLI